MTEQVPAVAQEQALAWLALADAGDANASWEAAGPTFKSAAPVERWKEMLGAARGPLGPLTSRTIAVAQRLNGLPGAPAGEYVVLQFHAVYDARKAVVETVTLQEDGQGVWRVVGYFIR